ncbi:MAG: fatty acid desaturase [Polyangiales bacterium]
MPRTLVLTDPRFSAKERLSWFDRQAMRIIRDPRDLPFVHLSMQITFVQIPCAIALFLPGVFRWWTALLYVAMTFAVFFDRYILMLHNTSHRKLFQKPHSWLGFYIPWVLGPFNGQTPGTYFAHHIGMHHAEENLLDDLSTTMPFQRDRFGHFLRYWGRFFLFGPIELPIYHGKKGKQHYVRMTIVGELAFYAWVVALGALAGWAPTLTVFVVPVVLARFLMMAGNWAQHAFIDPADPANPYLNSIVTINCRYNRRCYNDGYHIGHHESAGRHWTDMPGDFEAKRERYIAHDAIVFEGVDYFMIWLMLMTKQYGALANRFVDLRDTPREKSEIIALMQRRLKPIAVAEPVAHAATAAEA